MAESKQATALRKRQQIEKANRSMFAWVAGASVIVAFAIVAAQFMIQQGIFNERVIAEKRNTDGTLGRNLEAVDKLKENVNVLLTNKNLEESRAKAEDSNLQVVLDALPPTYDSLNLGTSLQTVLLGDKVQSIENLTINGSNGGSNSNGAVEDAAALTADGPQSIPFSFTVIGNYDQIKNALNSLERSIRPIQVTAIGIEGSDDNLTATIEAVTYFQNEKTIKLKEKTVAP